MTNSLSTTLLELIRSIFGEDYDKFMADPKAYLDENGHGDLSCVDFEDALASYVETNVGGSTYNLGANWGGGDDADKHHGGSTYHGGDDDKDWERVVEHVKHIHEGDVHNTYNHTTHIDDRDVVNDQSFKGTIIADGDVSFDNSIVNASGDGAVAAGDDINGDVNTGDISANDSGVVVGDGTARGGDDDHSKNIDKSDNSKNDHSDNSDNSEYVEIDVDNSDNSTSDHSGDTVNQGLGNLNETSVDIA